MKVPAILASLKQQRLNLQACISSTAECFEIHKNDPKEIVNLSRSVLASKEALDRVTAQINFIEIALGQKEKGILEDDPTNGG
jgi:hypothetical protein